MNICLKATNFLSLMTVAQKMCLPRPLEFWLHVYSIDQSIFYRKVIWEDSNFKFLVRNSIQKENIIWFFFQVVGVGLSRNWCENSDITSEMMSATPDVNSSSLNLPSWLISCTFRSKREKFIENLYKNVFKFWWTGQGLLKTWMTDSKSFFVDHLY